MSCPLCMYEAGCVRMCCMLCGLTYAVVCVLFVVCCAGRLQCCLCSTLPAVASTGPVLAVRVGRSSLVLASTRCCDACCL